MRYGRHGEAQQGGEIVLSLGATERTIRVERGSGRIEIDGMHEPWVDPDQ